jgi:diguanylate cyclase (GGDEF)-like protein
MQDRRLLQRASAVALYAVFVPLAFAVEVGYGGWDDNAPLLAAATVLLVGQALICAIWGDGMPAWGWTGLVVALPVCFVLYALASTDAAAALAIVLVVPVGWVALFLGWRLLFLSIVLNVAAVASLVRIDGGGGRRPLQLAVEATVIVMVGLIARSVVGALEGARQRAEQRAGTDPLTGAASRIATFEQLEELVAGSAGDPVGVAMIDLDFFKSVNDQFGHLAGDEVLRAVARELRQHLRSGDTVGRIGGEEFLVIVRNVRSPGELNAIAEKLRTAVERAPMPDELGAHHGQTISIGAVLVREPVPLRDVVSGADHALYTAKVNGRNQTRMAPPSAGTAGAGRPLDDDSSPQRVAERLLRSPTVLAESRAAVDLFAPSLCDESLEDARMLVNELVASRLHADDAVSPYIDLVIERRAGQLLIQVSDAGDHGAQPAGAAAPAGLSPLGRSIVGELSAAWGTHTDESTRIWAQLPARNRAEVEAAGQRRRRA